MVQLLSEDEFINQADKIPLQSLQWSLARHKGVEVLLRRDDLIDKYLSGNKFYKLFYNLHAAKENGQTQLLSFGGAWSNHIYALAAAAKLYGFRAIGVIRGERPKQLSPTLQDAEAWGMTLYFVSRRVYRDQNSVALYEDLHRRYGDFFEIPEGGANAYGVKGTRVLGEAIQRKLGSDYSSVCVPCGTANTLAGIAAGLHQKQNVISQANSVIGFSVLKDRAPVELNNEISLGHQVIAHQQSIGEQTANWRLITGFHGGGYGKKLPVDMHRFMLELEHESNIQLDPVYTVKMCWGVKYLLEKNYWPRGSRLILIHTGGLQGRRGFNLDCP